VEELISTVEVSHAGRLEKDVTRHLADLSVHPRALSASQAQDARGENKSPSPDFTDFGRKHTCSMGNIGIEHV